MEQDGLFTGIRGPSTLGILLRAFSFRHVRSSTRLRRGSWPGLPLRRRCCRSGTDHFLDFDDTVAPVYGSAKQGAGPALYRRQWIERVDRGHRLHSGRGAGAATRLRRGNAYLVRHGAKMVADTIPVARRVIRRAARRFLPDRWIPTPR